MSSVGCDYLVTILSRNYVDTLTQLPNDYCACNLFGKVAFCSQSEVAPFSLFFRFELTTAVPRRKVSPGSAEAGTMTPSQSRTNKVLKRIHISSERGNQATFRIITHGRKSKGLSRETRIRTKLRKRNSLTIYIRTGSALLRKSGDRNFFRFHNAHRFCFHRRTRLTFHNSAQIYPRLHATTNFTAEQLK
jgi:hypothetical protein